MTTLEQLDAATNARLRTMAERLRPWRCALCREQLGTVAHRRQGDPLLRLLPSIDQVEIGDGAVRITCPSCHAIMRWVVHRQRVGALDRT